MLGAQRIHLQYAGPALRRLRNQGEYELMNEFQPPTRGKTRLSTGRLPSVELPPSSVRVSASGHPRPSATPA